MKERVLERLQGLHRQVSRLEQRVSKRLQEQPEAQDHKVVPDPLRVFEGTLLRGCEGLFPDLRAAPDWDESKHPRDSSGRFGSGTKSHSTDAEKVKGPNAAEVKALRVWHEGVPPGMSKETWMDHMTGNPDKDPSAHAKPERQALHDKIIAEAVERAPRVPDGERLVAIMTMGGPGSGKSTIVKQRVDKSKFASSDPDAIKEQLPEYQKGTRPEATYKDSAKMSHEESSYLAKKIIDRSIAERRNVVVDGTGSNPGSFLKKMNALKKAGYEVHVLMPDLSVEEGSARALKRAERTGRYVPDPVVREAYSGIPGNFAKIASKADGFGLFDASRPGAPMVWNRVNGKTTVHDAEYVRKFKERNHVDGELD